MKARVLCDLVFNGGTLDNVTKPLVDGYFRLHGHKLYAPWKILMAMDLSSVRGLNCTRIETLHGVDGLAPYKCKMIVLRATIHMHFMAKPTIFIHLRLNIHCLANALVLGLKPS